MKDIWLLDESLCVRVYYDGEDCDFSDNICVSLEESCPKDEKLLIADVTHLYLTPAQAGELVVMLTHAVNRSMGFEDRHPSS